MSQVLGHNLAMAAESLVGTRFRLHGRAPATGLDCVGLVAEALRRCGCEPIVPSGYRLRSLDVAPLLRFAAVNRLRPVEGQAWPGDILLVHFDRVQPHLLLAAARGFVHAHAGLGRVVLQPGPCPWPLAGHWRIDAKG
jgi:hypothetical protein